MDYSITVSKYASLAQGQEYLSASIAETFVEKAPPFGSEISTMSVA